MTDSELYNKAADLIEKGWTQNAFARDEEGGSVNPDDNEAASWCLSGALWLVVQENKILNETSRGRVTTNYKLVNNLKLERFAPEWNDDPGRTQGQVAILLRNAAARSLLSEGE